MERDSGKPMTARFARAMQDLRFSAGDWLKPYRGREDVMALVLLPLAPVIDSAPATQGAEANAQRVRVLVSDPVYQLK